MLSSREQFSLLLNINMVLAFQFNESVVYIKAFLSKTHFLLRRGEPNTPTISIRSTPSSTLSFVLLVALSHSSWSSIWPEMQAKVSPLPKNHMGSPTFVLQFLFVLDYDHMNYDVWRELLEKYCCGFGVFDHLQPPKDPTSSNTEEWEHINSFVKSWIYNTLSPPYFKCPWKGSPMYTVYGLHSRSYFDPTPTPEPCN